MSSFIVWKEGKRDEFRWLRAPRQRFASSVALTAAGVAAVPELPWTLGAARLSASCLEVALSPCSFRSSCGVSRCSWRRALCRAPGSDVSLPSMNDAAVYDAHLKLGMTRTAMIKFVKDRLGFPETYRRDEVKLRWVTHLFGPVNYKPGNDWRGTDRARNLTGYDLAEAIRA